MNKLELTIDLVLSQCRGGTSLCHQTIIDTMQIVDFIEEESVRRGWNFPEKCPKCNSEIKKANVGGHYIFSCDCERGKSGPDIREAFMSWYDKVKQ